MKVGVKDYRKFHSLLGEGLLYLDSIFIQRSAHVMQMATPQPWPPRAEQPQYRAMKIIPPENEKCPKFQTQVRPQDLFMAQRELMPILIHHDGVWKMYFSKIMIPVYTSSQSTSKKLTLTLHHRLVGSIFHSLKPRSVCDYGQRNAKWLLRLCEKW